MRYCADFGFDESNPGGYCAGARVTMEGVSWVYCKKCQQVKKGGDTTLPPDMYSNSKWCDGCVRKERGNHKARLAQTAKMAPFMRDYRAGGRLKSDCEHDWAEEDFWYFLDDDY